MSSEAPSRDIDPVFGPETDHIRGEGLGDLAALSRRQARLVGA